jgi:hypothetical protein
VGGGRYSYWRAASACSCSYSCSTSCLSTHPPSHPVTHSVAASPLVQVYLASASPPVRYPNVYGVDMPTRT